MFMEQRNKTFCSLDLPSAYWQVPMAAESRENTAFSTFSGHFECVRPFGLKTAPITSLRMINSITGHDRQEYPRIFR